MWSWGEGPNFHSCRISYVIWFLCSKWPGNVCHGCTVWRRSAGAFISHWVTHCRHGLALIWLLWQCLVWLTRMQFCRRVLCQPCSARVTSPEEDMEYKMGSCIGISQRQVILQRRGSCSARASGGIQEQPGGVGEGRFTPAWGGRVGEVSISIVVWKWVQNGRRVVECCWREDDTGVTSSGFGPCGVCRRRSWVWRLPLGNRSNQLYL